MSEQTQAPKVWRGRFQEDLEVGDVYRSRLGRTISETDNTWFTLLTCNTNQVHFNSEFAAGTRFGQILVNSCLTLSIVVGLSVPDTSENATANLCWTKIEPSQPRLRGRHDLGGERGPVQARVQSRPDVGIVGVRTRGINQRREVVVEYERSFMVYRRDAPEVTGGFPETETDWTVGSAA